MGDVQLMLLFPPAVLSLELMAYTLMRMKARVGTVLVVPLPPRTRSLFLPGRPQKETT